MKPQIQFLHGIPKFSSLVQIVTMPKFIDNYIADKFN
jgi:hypothetical protein